MATVSFRVPEEIKAKMDDYEEINWSAVLRRHIEAEISELESRSLAHAVATSERLSQQIDEDEVAGTNTVEVVRAFRDERYGGESV